MTHSSSRGRKRHIRTLVGVTSTAALLFVAGCGSSSDADPKPSARESGKVSMGTPEKKKVKVGISVADSAYLPLYVCVRVTCKDNGVELELVTFQGDAETNQALLGGAVDFNVQALAGMMNLLKTGKEVRAFYGGMNTADFAWVAQPGIKSWDDLKGKRIGVTTFGSLTDSLTRQALTQQGLEPEKDVQIIQAGGSPTSWPTIKAGALDAGILSINFWLQAEEQGFTILGKQKDEIAPTWPKEVFVAPVEFIDANPNTITAILRGFSAAVELIHKDKKLATSVLSEELKYKPERADKVYDAISSSFHADGRMAEEAMPVFWKVMQTNQVVDGPLDPEKWLVTDWLDTYDEWVKK